MSSDTRPGTTDASAPADADASLRFWATPDRMRGGVSHYVPARGQGRPLSLEFLRQAMAATGITAPLDMEQGTEVVRLLLAGEDARARVLVRGKRPQSVRDAWFEPACPAGAPVFPGQVLGRLHPGTPAQPGLDIAGIVVPPEEQRTPREIALCPGIAQDAEGLLTARLAGLLRVGEGRLDLEPLVRISDDRLEALAALHPKDALGGMIRPEDMVLALSAQGVVFGMDLPALVAGLAQARVERRVLEGVVVARGQAPVPGEPGRLELLGASQAPREEPDESQRLDYHDRGQFPTARKGEDIARLRPPTRGTAGRDVLGREIPARDGAALRIQPGKGVESLEEGTLFRARLDGAVLVGRASLDVSELLSLSGDVDFGTGNILLDTGSVRVAGTVRSGFAVEAPGAVLVEGMVESARIKAGKDVVVRGGIFMSGDEAAFVQAGGSVSAAYTHNAQVQAGGDVTVALAIVGSKTSKGSRVTSGGFVRVTDPKGRVMGGTVVCASGMEIFQAGSERGFATTLAISHETPEVEALVKEMRELKALLSRAVFVLGEGDGGVALSRLSGERMDEAKELLARREGAESRLRQIRTTLAAMAQEHLERVASARIVVRGVVYPGVAIKMGGTALYVEEPLEHCVFSWDPKAKQIVTGS